MFKLRNSYSYRHTLFEDNSIRSNFAHKNFKNLIILSFQPHLIFSFHYNPAFALKFHHISLILIVESNEMKVVEKSESKSNFEDRERTQKIISMYWAREKKKSGVCWCACQFACVRYIEQCECWKLAVCLLSNYQFEHQSNFTFFFDDCCLTIYERKGMKKAEWIILCLKSVILFCFVFFF